MNKKTVLAACAVLLVAGCATSKVWQATGGSRADGIVKLSYQYVMFEVPELASDGTELAAERCKVWGYDGAQAFGGVTEQCNNFGPDGCTSWMVTKEFQCTGEGRGGYAEIFIPSPAHGAP